jgi:hypothetical protein
MPTLHMDGRVQGEWGRIRKAEKKIPQLNCRRRSGLVYLVLTFYQGTDDIA